MNAAVADYVAGVAGKLRKAGLRVEVSSGERANAFRVQVPAERMPALLGGGALGESERMPLLLLRPVPTCKAQHLQSTGHRARVLHFWRSILLPLVCLILPPLYPVLSTLPRAGLSVGKAIRASEKDKIPVMCVIGVREAEQGAVAVRTYVAGDQGSMPVDELVAKLTAANAARAATL